jgi:4-amino-4-deoxy-L-arabinose transferase-like glycosyltransferase
MGSPLKIGHLILFFALAAAPFAATFALYYPDERHYTDGALWMLQHGGWLVPHTATGAARFEKPILAYWAVAGSWRVFGINVLAARLPFLLAGCGTLWLTHRLARKLTGNDRLALLAALVLAAHPQFFLSSVRSMPDALLVFFVTLSAFGFLRLLVFEEFTAGAFWMAYGGATGAALSKGLLGAGIVLFAWAFAFGQQRDWGAVKKLIHWPSAATGIFLVAGWLGYIFATQGRAAFAVFFGDQVTGNLHGHWWSPAWRAPLYALALVLNFLPWSAPVLELFARKKSTAAAGVPAGAQKFILAWTAVLVAGFALGENVSLRYLLPAAPLMAILVAGWLQGADDVKLVFSVRRLLLLALVIGGLLVAAAGDVSLQLSASPAATVLTCGIFLFGFGALACGALSRRLLPVGEALGLAVLLGWLVFFVEIIPLVLPDRAQQIAATLRHEFKTGDAPVLLVGDVKLASRVRLLLGPDWSLRQADQLNPADAANYTRILVSEKDAGEFSNRGWKIQTAAVSFDGPPHAELWSALKPGALAAVLARHRQNIFLVTPE